jgi:hypothetical protein
MYQPVSAIINKQLKKECLMLQSVLVVTVVFASVCAVYGYTLKPKALKGQAK